MELATTQRSFKIKNCEFDLDVPMYDAKSTLSCIIHVINDEKSDLEDLERQLYRFDTHGVSCKEMFLTGSRCCKSES